MNHPTPQDLIQDLQNARGMVTMSAVRWTIHKYTMGFLFSLIVTLSGVAVGVAFHDYLGMRSAVAVQEARLTAVERETKELGETLVEFRAEFRAESKMDRDERQQILRAIAVLQTNAGKP